MIPGWTSQSADGTESGTPGRGERQPPTQALHQAREFTSIYLSRSRLGLEARTLSRLASFALIPAFTFSVLTTAMLGASLIRLLAGPALAALIVMSFHLTSLARDAGILQSAMPVAVLASIIAFAHDLLPTFVTATVLFSTLISIVTLVAIIVILGCAS